eukprot:75721-Hanusia_phi.AAC.1
MRSLPGITASEALKPLRKQIPLHSSRHAPAPLTHLSSPPLASAGSTHAKPVSDRSTSGSLP